MPEAKYAPAYPYGCRVLFMQEVAVDARSQEDRKSLWIVVATMRLHELLQERYSASVDELAVLIWNFEAALEPFLGPVRWTIVADDAADPKEPNWDFTSSFAGDALYFAYEALSEEYIKGVLCHGPAGGPFRKLPMFLHRHWGPKGTKPQTRGLPAEDLALLNPFALHVVLER